MHMAMSGWLEYSLSMKENYKCAIMVYGLFYVLGAG